MALAGGVAEPMRLKVLERLAVVCRRAGDHSRSHNICLELTRSEQFSIVGYEGAAIYAERVEQDYEAALSLLQEGLGRTENPRCQGLLQNRITRLQQKAIRF
jgi:hypothetical protein